MNRARLRDALTGLAAADARQFARHLCSICSEMTGVAGASVMVMEGGAPQAALCCTDAVAAQIEDLQYTLGEGPAVDAYEDGAPVAEPHLAHPERVRWPAFSPAALAAGTAAIFSFPLHSGGARLGALTLYQARPGRLSDEQHLDALAMADLVLQLVLAHQAKASPGALASELEALVRYQAEVHQAAGMVSVQLGVEVGVALVRLRARAYLEGRPLASVAADVVGRRLRLSA